MHLFYISDIAKHYLCECLIISAFSSYYKLDNLVAIVDVNRLGQSQETALGHQIEVYQVCICVIQKLYIFMIVLALMN